ncbi:MAG: polymerase sigma-70 factor, subfamily [Actinomycetota bacterium]
MGVAVAIEPAYGQDDQAFTALYREVREPLVAYCRRLTNGVGDPEAIAQEALLRAWQSWDRTTGRPLWPWVLTVARNLVIDEHRRTGRRTALASRAAMAATGDRFPDPEGEIMRAAEHDAVRRAFDGLPAPYQTVVQLHHVEGRSYQEIADLQDVTTETVRGMLRRARHALRAAYVRLEGVPAVVAVGTAFRRLRLRTDALAARAQVRLAETNAFFLPVDAVRGAVAVALIFGATGVAPARTTPPRRPGSVEMAAAPATVPSRAHTTSTTRGEATSTTAPEDALAAASPSGLPFGLGGNDVTTPEEAYFTQLAPTDQTNGDNTVFAVGDAPRGCATVSCPVLFRSADGGATWQRVAATGFRGGSVMLPPAWPADNRIFVLGPDALQESSDGGATFIARTPAGRTGAMSPGFSSGDPVIWVGFAPGWVFHDDTRAVTPLQMWPPPVADYATYAFSPAWPADNRVLLGGWNLGDDGLQSATVTRCRNSTCSVPVVLPGLIGSPELLALPSFVQTGTAFAWSGDRLFRTDDAGGSYHRVRLPGPGKVSTLVATRSDQLFLALAEVTPDGPVGGLYLSTDRGTTWRQLGAHTALSTGVSAVAALHNGNILAAVQPTAGGGLLCSADGGGTWRRRC